MVSLTFDLTPQQATQIMNLFDHWSEVQHDDGEGDDETGSTPTEDFSSKMAHRIRRMMLERGYFMDYRSHSFLKAESAVDHALLAEEKKRWSYD
jgi:hypothetical protein